MQRNVAGAQEEIEGFNEGSFLVVHIQCKKIITAAQGDEAQQLLEDMADVEERATAQHNYITKLQDKLKALQTDFNECASNQCRFPNRIPDFRTDSSTDAATGGLKISNDSLEEMQQLVPRALKLLQELEQAESKAGGALKNTEGKLAELRNKIALARDTANRVCNVFSCKCKQKRQQIAVGAEFGGTSSLRVRNPSRLRRSASYTQLSMHVRTRTQDGLLLFLGNEKGTAGEHQVQTVISDILRPLYNRCPLMITSR